MMRFRSTIGCLLLLAAAAAMHAAPLAPDLGYTRIGQKTTSVNTSAGAMILDLRAAADEKSALKALEQLAVTPPPKLAIILIAPTLPESVLERITRLPRCLTIGRADSAYSPDVAVSASAEADQQAVKALEEGTAPDALVTENTDKPRFDESALVHERRPPATVKEPAPAADDATVVTETAPAGNTAVDAVLQRAVQVYLGLNRLGKI